MFVGRLSWFVCWFQWKIHLFIFVAISEASVVSKSVPTPPCILTVFSLDFAHNCMRDCCLTLPILSCICLCWFFEGPNKSKRQTAHGKDFDEKYRAIMPALPLQTWTQQQSPQPLCLRHHQSLGRAQIYLLPCRHTLQQHLLSPTCLHQAFH